MSYLSIFTSETILTLTVGMFFKVYQYFYFVRKLEYDTKRHDIVGV